MAAHRNLGAQFVRQPEGGETDYAVYPTGSSPDMVRASGTHMTVSHSRALAGYAYGSFKEPEPSAEFKGVYDVLNQIRPTTGYLHQGTTTLMRLGERDLEGKGLKLGTVHTEGNDLVAGKAIHDLGRTAKGQLKLFGHGYEPAKSVVESLGGTQRARVHVPTMLAIADADSRQRYGVGLSASDNRSKYSEQLTQHLGQQLEQPMTKRTRENWSEFHRDPGLERPRDEKSYREVPAGEVRNARNTVRAMMQPKHRRSDYEQGKLDL